MNLGNEPCIKCRGVQGYDWTWSKNFDGTGYATCKGCGLDLNDKKES